MNYRTENTEVFDLEPSRSETQKSFYGKAYVIRVRDHDHGREELVLVSYGTVVAVIIGQDCYEPRRYSRTTNRHVKSFIERFDATRLTCDYPPDGHWYEANGNKVNIGGDDD